MIKAQAKNRRVFWVPDGAVDVGDRPVVSQSTQVRFKHEHARSIKSVNHNPIITSEWRRPSHADESEPFSALVELDYSAGQMLESEELLIQSKSPRWRYQHAQSPKNVFFRTGVPVAMESPVLPVKSLPEKQTTFTLAFMEEKIESASGPT